MANEILSMIEEVGLSQRKEGLLNTAKPSIRLEPVIKEDEEEEETYMVGESKFGGLPDLPANLEWPTNGEEHLSFIAQINFGDLVCKDKKCQLPTHGMLYFFYDIDRQPWGYAPEEKRGWRVLYYDGDPSLLRRTPAPADIEEDLIFAEYPVRFIGELTLPPFESMEIEEMGLNENELDAYYNLIDEIELDFEEGEKERLGRMLGYPDQIQGNMQVECELVSRGINLEDDIDLSHMDIEQMEASARKWILLLQVESSSLTEMMWGDEGRIYFWIKKEDLEALRFDQIRLILQCY